MREVTDEKPQVNTLKEGGGSRLKVVLSDMREMVFLPLLRCQRRPQEYTPLSSIDCVDLARSATRTASPAENSRPSIFNCRAVPKRESSFPPEEREQFSNLTSTFCRRKEEKQEYALLFECVSIKVRAKEGEARFGSSSLQQPKLEEGLEISYHREKMKFEKIITSIEFMRKQIIYFK